MSFTRLLFLYVRINFSNDENIFYLFSKKNSEAKDPIINEGPSIPTAIIDCNNKSHPSHAHPFKQAVLLMPHSINIIYDITHAMRPFVFFIFTLFDI